MKEKREVVSVSELQLQKGLIVPKSYVKIYDHADDLDQVATMSIVLLFEDCED